VGAGAGLAAGALYAPHRDHTYGDASVMRTAGLLGGYTGIALVQTFGATDYENSSTIGAMTGATLGLLVGDRLVRRTDFTFSQGVLMNLSTIGGGLFGLGLGLFASGNDDIKEQALWGMSAVGSVTGYALAYAANAKSARRADADRSSWRFDMVPTPPAHRGGMPGVMMTVRTTLD
jgi:drug/metabolite transporter (DMT)-like permease